MADGGSAAVAKSPVVLVVEDEEPIRFMVAEGLQSAGYATVEAGGSVQALEILERHPVDLVFTDVRMPGQMDGAELAFAIERRWPDLPIIVGSGNFDPKALRLPRGSSFIAKPYRLHSLTALIAGMLQRK